jgi:beta-glucanase (GH16 family)
MARDKKSAKEDEETSLESTVNRRNYLKIAGASATALSGLFIGSNSVAGASGGGPVNPNEWTRVFQDTFSSGSLDNSSWEVGYGWGNTSEASAERITSDNVAVKNNRLHLSGTHDAQEVYAGAVNTRNKVMFGPGSFVEARLKNPFRVGFLPAFWAKPNSGDWPPEIDIMELFMTGESTEDEVSSANFNIHYSSSTEPGDGSTHEMLPTHHGTSSDLTDSFHVFGCAWLKDRVEWFFDGQKVGECTDETALTSLEHGAPFYLMLNIGVDSIGDVNYNESWGEKLVVDWVRVWEK